MTQKKPTEPSIIKNWVRTASVQMDNGEMHHMIVDIMGETTPDEKADIRQRLATMSLALRELCSSELTFQFHATFTREVDEMEWQVSHPETLVTLNEKSNESQEKIERILENTFHILTDKLKDIAENYLWKEPKVGIYHSVFSDRFGHWEHQSPFKTPLILPSIERKVEKILWDYDEVGKEKYIKVEVNQWTGKVMVETIATLDDKFAGYCKNYTKFMDAVHKESQYLTDTEYRDFMERYNRCKCINSTFECMKKAIR